MKKYTEYERQLIAAEEYAENLAEGKDVVIKNNGIKLHIGTVTKIYGDRQSGLRAIVVKDSTVA